MWFIPKHFIHHIDSLYLLAVNNLCINLCSSDIGMTHKLACSV